MAANLTLKPVYSSSFTGIIYFEIQQKDNMSFSSRRSVVIYGSYYPKLNPLSFFICLLFSHYSDKKYDDKKLTNFTRTQFLASLEGHYGKRLP